MPPNIQENDSSPIPLILGTSSLCPHSLQSLSPLAPTTNCVTSGSDFLFFHHLLHSMCLSPPAAAASSRYISALPFQLTQDSQAQQQILLKVWGHRGGITASALESTHRRNSPQKFINHSPPQKISHYSLSPNIYYLLQPLSPPPDPSI